MSAFHPIYRQHSSRNMSLKGYQSKIPAEIEYDMVLLTAINDNGINIAARIVNRRTCRVSDTVIMLTSWFSNVSEYDLDVQVYFTRLTWFHNRSAVSMQTLSWPSTYTSLSPESTRSDFHLSVRNKVFRERMFSWYKVRASKVLEMTSK